MKSVFGDSGSDARPDSLQPSETLTGTPAAAEVQMTETKPQRIATSSSETSYYIDFRQKAMGVLHEYYSSVYSMSLKRWIVVQATHSTQKTMLLYKDLSPRYLSFEMSQGTTSIDWLLRRVPLGPLSFDLFEPRSGAKSLTLAVLVHHDYSRY